jgi:hypothetical protein
MLEIWRDHPTYTTFKGSNLGNAKSNKSENTKNLIGTIPFNDKILSVFDENKKEKKVKFKDFIYECFNDIIPKDMFIIQNDRNFNNLNINNLKLVNKEEYNNFLLYDRINQKEKEGWKLHPIYKYMVNKKGDIYSVVTDQILEGKIISYENTIKLINNKTFLLKNFIYECFYGIIPDKHNVIYKDGIMNNYNIDNLELLNEEQFKEYKQNQLNKIKEVKLKEGWKAHYKFLNYLGNEEGKVFSLLKNEITNGHNIDGYYRINIHDDKIYGQYPIHRFIYECFNSKIKDKIQIDHINSITTDNSLKNLQALTTKEHHKKTFENNKEAHLKQAIKLQKKIILIEYDNNNIISEKIYDKAEDLEKILNLSRITIAIYAKNEKKIKKYQIKYYEDKIENEIWKKIEDDNRFDGYEFSNMGRIKKKNSLITYGNLNHMGYFTININNSVHSMHYLICLAFNGKPKGEYGNEISVDHIDRNRGNNKSDNLRWATKFEQASNTSTVKRIIAKYKDTKEIIGTYVSASEAQRQLGINLGSILRVCKGEQKYSGKLNNREIIWEFDKTVI